MKNKVMENINAVLIALNSITVSGKANLSNLSGSISVLEQTAAILGKADVIECVDGDKK